MGKQRRDTPSGTSDSPSSPVPPPRSMPRRHTCRFHCTVCNRHFASLAAYDAHKDRVYEGITYSPSCCHPRGQGLTEYKNGRCDTGPVTQEGVDIWHT